MTFGVSTQSLISLRSEPDHRSEMVSQILFGELFRIIFSEKTWIRVRLTYDNYEGWIEQKQATLLDEGEFLRLLNADTPVSNDLVQLISLESRKTVMPIVLGSSLPGIMENKFVINHENFFFEGGISDSKVFEDALQHSDRHKVRQSIVDDAMLYHNAPYLWGGRSPFGIDCSGFTQMVYKLKKIRLMRDASQQANHGEPLSFITESEPGDLVFFDNEEGVISHVGMMIDKQRIIHASGSVRIDKIDHEGIYNEAENRYTHKLRIIKRMV